MAKTRTAFSKANRRFAMKFLKIARRTTNDFDRRRRVNARWIKQADLQSIIEFLSASHRQGWDASHASHCLSRGMWQIYASISILRSLSPQSFNYLVGWHLGLKNGPCGCMTSCVYWELVNGVKKKNQLHHKIWKSFAFDGKYGTYTDSTSDLRYSIQMELKFGNHSSTYGTCTVTLQLKFLFPPACPPGHMPRFKLESELGGPGQVEVWPAWGWWALNPANKKGFPKKHFLAQKNHGKLERAICSDKRAIWSEIVRFVDFVQNHRNAVVAESKLCFQWMILAATLHYSFLQTLSFLQPF